MKKVLLILAIVVAYSVSMANTNAKVSVIENSEVAFVVDTNDISVNIEEEKDKKKAKKATATKASADTKTKAVGEKPSTGCGDAQKKSCAASGKTCGDAKATTTKTSSCCGSKK